MRVALVADIGQPVYHVGDEAIGHAAHAALVARGIRPLMLTRSPADTRRRFGDVDSAPTPQFPWDPMDRKQYLDRIIAFSQGDRRALAADDPVLEVIDSLRSCDALVVAGGGNLNSRFGWLLYERAALAELADGLGMPVVISGQTLGPVITREDRGVVARLLRQARLVGLRDAQSVDLALEIVPTASHVVPTLDDATFVGLPSGGESAPSPGHRLVATFSLDTGPLPRERVIPSVASLLDEAVSLVEAPVDFIPHMATPGAHDGDEEMHRRIADHMSPGNAVLHPVTSAIESAERTRQADLVITTRFHPAVFAAAGGASVVCLAPDDYAASRMRGVLTRWGFPPALALPLTCVVHDDLEAALSQIWETRGERHDLAAKIWPSHRNFVERWWDAVVSVLKGERPTIPAVESPAPSPAIGAVEVITRRHSWYLPMTRMLEGAQQEFELARSEATATRQELDSILRTRAFRTAQSVWAARIRLSRPWQDRR